MEENTTDATMEVDSVTNQTHATMPGQERAGEITKGGKRTSSSSSVGHVGGGRAASRHASDSFARKRLNMKRGGLATAGNRDEQVVCREAGTAQVST